MKQKILKIIKQGESQKVEFKSKANDGLGKSICSFANTNNGVVLIGVSDDRKIIGIDKKHEREIANIAHSCKPSVYPKIKFIEIEGKNIFIVEVKKSDSLHSFKNIAYKRIASHNKPLSPEEVIEFAKNTGKIRWDEQICKGAEIEDIDEEKVRWFLRKAEAERNFDVEPETPIKEALKRLELIKNKKITNAAILLFGRNPQKFFLQAETRCARFKGTKPVKPFLDMKVFSGNIFDQVDKTLDFVLGHIPMAAWLVSGKAAREEKYIYPPDAIREAIVNAICHRDYESPSNVQARVFDDRVEIWNSGRLPNNWTVERLKQKHESVPKNPLIANQFFLIKFIEKWGTGTNEIIKKCLGWGLPEPIFEFTGTSLIVIFKGYVLAEELDKLNLNKRQKEIIIYLQKHKEIIRSEYQKIFNISERTANRELLKLVDLGLILKKSLGVRTYYTMASYGELWRAIFNYLKKGKN